MKLDLLGHAVKDLTTGMLGIAVSRSESLSHSDIRYGVQPRGDGSTSPDAFEVDSNLLQKTEEGRILEIVEPGPQEYNHFKPGDKIQDVTTGIVGSITHRTVYCNGCVIYAIQENRKIAFEGDKTKHGVHAPAAVMIQESSVDIMTKRKEAVKEEKSFGPPPTRIKKETLQRY
jgi:hypothetical protein